MIETGEDGRVGNELLIGDKLRQARLSKNISLDELQQKTKIQKRYLEAIEKGAFDLLPGDYYVRTFLKQYAAAVGENGDHLVAVFNGELELDATTPAKERPVIKMVEGSRMTTHQPGKNRTWMDYLPTILIAMIALTILIIVGYLSIQDKKANPMIATPSTVEVQNEATSESSVVESTKETTTSSEVMESSSSSEELKMAMTIEHVAPRVAEVKVENVEKPVQIDFTGLDDRCWVGVQVDGAYILQYTLAPKEKQSITLPEGVTNVKITFGASSNVQMHLNQELVDFAKGAPELLQKDLNVTLTYA